MPFSTDYIVTVDTKNAPKFRVAVPISDPPLRRNTTLFHVIAEDDRLSFIGTYDQIIEYATSLMHGMYGWAVLNRHSEWFGDPVEITDQEMRDAGNGNNREAGTSRDTGYCGSPLHDRGGDGAA